MGLWDRVREWLAGGPERVPDVASFDDAKLARLWRERDELTDTAREAVRAECTRRGLRLRGLVPKQKGPAARGDVIDVRPGPLLLLQTTPGRFALVLLPRWSPDAYELPSGLPLDAIVVCNHERRGWLDTSRVAAATGVGADAIHATAEGPIDRAPGESSGAATQLPSELTLGSLTLRRMAGLSGVLRASWRGSPVTAAIGPTLPGALVEAQPPSTVYVGTLAEPEAVPAWSALLAAAHATSMMAVLPGAPRTSSGPSVILAGDAIGAPLRRHTHLHPGFGISVVGTECPVAPSAVALLGDVLAGRWDPPPDAAPRDVEDVMEHLVVEGRVDDACRIVRATERSADATLRRLDATMRALDGDLAGALDALALAAERDPFALVVASSVRCAQGDLAGAERDARRALESAPSDPDAIAALVRALWLAGRVDDARAVVDDAPAFSLTGTQAADLYASIEPAPPAQPPREVVLPHVARRALVVARAANDRERALAAYRRAVELDPWCAPARTALESLARS